MPRLLHLIVAAALLVAATLPIAAASPDGAPTTAATPPTPAAPQVLSDPLGRDTPEGMVGGFLRAVAAEDLTRAARYLNLQSLPNWQREQRGAELAAMLQQALDRAGWVAARWQLSDAPAGAQDDGLPPGVDRFGAVRTDGGRVDLLAERGPGPEGTPVWRVSADTVARIPDLLARASAAPIDLLLPATLAETRLAGAPLGHWFVLVVLAGLAYALARAASGAIRWAARRLLRRLGDGAGNGTGTRLIEAADPPLQLLLAVVAFGVASVLLGVSIVARSRAGVLAEAVAWLALLWFAWRIMDVTAATGAGRAMRRGHLAALSAISLMRRTGKVVLLGLAAILALDSLGVDVTAGLAALGIGGLAIALGAQKTVENFVGSLTLIADQPVRVGDFCRFGEVLGTVEDIGMRSTQIRTLERTVVTVPNGEMASLRLENYSRRDRFWYHPLLALRYETTPDQIRWLLVRLREMLYAHPRVDPDPARVRFLGLGADSLRVEIFAYVLADTYDDFLEVQEDLSLRVMDIVREGGAAFAFPSRTLYLARDPAADAGGATQAAAQVHEWAEAGELPLPRFSAERIAALRDTAIYPPEGAAMRGPRVVRQEPLR